MSVRRQISKSPIGLRAEFRTGQEIPKADRSPARKLRAGFSQGVRESKTSTPKKVKREIKLEL